MLVKGATGRDELSSPQITYHTHLSEKLYFQNVKIKYDVYLSYHNDDKDQVDKVLEVLKKEKQDMRIFSRQQHLDAEAAWQNEIHDTMLQCAR